MTWPIYLLITGTLLLVGQIFWLSYIDIKKNQKLYSELERAIREYCISARFERFKGFTIIWYTPKFKRDIFIDRIVANYYDYRPINSKLIILKETQDVRNINSKN